jgi:hypothetical protein
MADETWTVSLSTSHVASQQEEEALQDIATSITHTGVHLSGSSPGLLVLHAENITKLSNMSEGAASSCKLNNNSCKLNNFQGGLVQESASVATTPWGCIVTLHCDTCVL